VKFTWGYLFIMAALCNRGGHYIYRQHCAQRKPAGI